MDDPTVIERRHGDPPDRDRVDRPRRRAVRVVGGVAALAAAVGVYGALSGEDRPSPEVTARCSVGAASGDRVRAAFEATGGFPALRVAEAEGAFEIVTFDPFDDDRLIAAHRSGYGPAENQALTQRWRVHDGDVEQVAWDPDTPHDFVHHNPDGTVTMWVHAGDDIGHARRDAVVFDRDGAVVTTTSSPLYADRFAVDAGTVFALEGDPYRYRPRDTGYEALVADDGRQRIALAGGADLAWIDVPTPGLLVAYAADPGVTSVWDTATLERLDDHPLAGRPYRRLAVAGDAATAVGVTHDGELEALDLATAAVGPRFGRVDVTEVDRPIVLGADGSRAVTVDRDGTVTVWHVGDGVPVATYAGATGLPRWLPTSRSAARVTSVIAPDATRVALYLAARPGVGVTWWLVDLDVDEWLTRDPGC